MATTGPGRLYKRGNMWWASCYIEGVEVRRRGGSKREAEKVLVQLRRERETGRPHVALSGVLSAYRRDLAVRGKPRTVKTYDESVRVLEDYFGPDFNVLDLKTQTILDFLEERAKTRQNISANRPARNLRVALHHAIEDKVLKEMPCRIRVLREEKKKPNILTVEEFEQVLQATEHEGARIALILAYQCGLRHDEIVHLRTRDIIYSEPRYQIAVRGYGGRSPKTHAERRVPLNRTVMSEIVSEHQRLHRFLHLPDEANVPLIYWGVNKPHRYRDLYKQIRDGFQKAELWDVDAKTGLHMCRRTFASHLLSAGHDLKTVMELGGWSTIEAAQRYLASTDELKLAAVDSLALQY